MIFLRISAGTDKKVRKTGKIFYPGHFEGPKTYEDRVKPIYIPTKSVIIQEKFW